MLLKLLNLISFLIPFYSTVLIKMFIFFSKSGFLSALPSLLMIFFSLPAAWLADGLINKMVTKKGIIRKSFATVALVGPALCLICLAFTGCNQALAVVWLCMAVMFAGAHNSGMNVRFSCHFLF